MGLSFPLGSPFGKSFWYIFSCGMYSSISETLLFFMLPKAKPKAAALRIFHQPREVWTIAGCMSKNHPKPSPLAGNIFLPKIHPFGKTSTSYRHVAHWWHVIVPVPCFRGAKSPRMVSVAGISRFKTQPIIIYIYSISGWNEAILEGHSPITQNTYPSTRIHH